jgi:HAD superfamily, subfamily IIIB (Acid phosphatase)
MTKGEYMGSFKAVRRMPRAVAVLALIGLVAAAVAAYAATVEPAIKTSTPHSERQITNLDVLRQQIRNYYGDPLGTGTFAPDSNYAREAGSVAEDGEHYLASHAHGKHDGRKGSKANTPAIILDVDDTSLATWNYEVFSNWAFNPTTNGDFVTQQKFPAVPGMVDLATQAAKEGYAIIFLTGRGATQEPATLGNLTSDGVGVDAGYPQPTTLNDGEDGLFTKPAVASYPDYLKAACSADPNGSCTTIHYKSATRAHVESLGYDIVADFGDQFSDLEGGHSGKTFKLPNPNYFLP